MIFKFYITYISIYSIRCRSGWWRSWWRASVRNRERGPELIKRKSIIYHNETGNRNKARSRLLCRVCLFTGGKYRTPCNKRWGAPTKNELPGLHSPARLVLRKATHQQAPTCRPRDVGLRAHLLQPRQRAAHRERLVAAVL